MERKAGRLIRTPLKDGRRQTVNGSMPAAAPAPRLLDRVLGAIRARHYSPSTEQAYMAWIRRFIFFHEKRHPTEMGVMEVKTRHEVRAVLDGLDGALQLVCSLLYGSGLRLLESLRLRIKDIDFHRNEITVRDGKGGKDRVTMLPAAAREPLLAHLEKVRRQHARIWLAVWAGPHSLMPSRANTRTPIASRPGSGSFRPRRTTRTATPGCGTGITCTSPSSRGL